MNSIQFHARIDRSLIQTERELVARWGDYDKPLVSIECLTYNHEKYIADALDGFLIQQTDFPFEILVHDDASTDRTPEIIRSYEERYPNIIKPIYQKENQYSQGKKPNVFNYERAQGMYIATCEGDDYWIDPCKIQKQVSFLNLNGDYSMCFHSVVIENVFLNTLRYEIPAEDRTYEIDELLLKKIAHYTSFVFRRAFLRNEILTNHSIFGGDLVLALMMAEGGKVYGMRDYMGLYRRHPGGVTHINANKLGVDHYKRFIQQFVYIRKTFKTLSRYASTIKIADNCMTVYLYYKDVGKIIRFKYLLMALYYRPEMLYGKMVKIVKKRKSN